MPDLIKAYKDTGKGLPAQCVEELALLFLQGHLAATIAKVRYWTKKLNYDFDQDIMLSREDERFLSNAIKYHLTFSSHTDFNKIANSLSLSGKILLVLAWLIHYESGEYHGEPNKRLYTAGLINQMLAAREIV